MVSIEVLEITGAAAAGIHDVGVDTRCRALANDVHVLDTVENDLSVIIRLMITYRFVGKSVTMELNVAVNCIHQQQITTVTTFMVSSHVFAGSFVRRLSCLTLTSCLVRVRVMVMVRVTV